MNEISEQAELLAKAVYEIRLLLSGYVGSQASGDPEVRAAAAIAYALHNFALSTIEGQSFDVSEAMGRIQATHEAFGIELSSAFKR